jgi:gluconolactonase
MASDVNLKLRDPFGVSRRTFLVAAGVGTAHLALPGCGDDGGGAVPDARPQPGPPDARRTDGGPFDAGPDRYAGLDTDSYLGAIEVVAAIEGEALLEGLAMGPDGNIYFTNVPASQILVFTPAQAPDAGPGPAEGAGSVSEFRASSNAASGLLLGPDGRLIVCEGGLLAGAATGTGRVIAIDVQTLVEEVLADAYMGQDLQPPSDVTFDVAPAGPRYYFSSRPNALDATDESAGTVNAVYRVDVNGSDKSVHRLLAWPMVDKPSGIVTSPDGTVLYLIDAHGGANKKRHIMAYDIDAGGNLGNGRVIYDFYPGRSGDGMAIDDQGNLYVAAGLHNLRSTSETLDTRPGIHVISPQGQLLAFRETPVDLVTSCTFAGDDLKTLYVTCGNLLLRLPTVIPGKAAYRVTPAAG